MPTVTINNAAMTAIRNASQYEFKESGVRVGPDEWRVPLKDDTLDRIRSAALKGETLSDTILRVVSLGRMEGKRQ